MVLVKVSNIKLPINKDENDALEKALKKSGISQNDIDSWKVLKYSVDARKKDKIEKIFSIGIYVKKYTKNRKDVSVVKEKKYTYSVSGTKTLNNRPIVVGFGPAGMFASLLLAQNGYNPIIIERGSDVDTRAKAVEDFWKTGILNINTNVQFGEGGAGTFSDGKLNTGIKDKENRIRFVLETFVKFGADKKILYESKPHIGTDILKKVVYNMRQYIIKKGGTFFFDTLVDKIYYSNGRISKITTSNGKVFETELCILAIGHSARDTFEMLYDEGVKIEPKPFAIGVRVEHKQSDINKSMYGFKDNRLGAASYKLTYKSSNNRGVYSFCMCPGGYVVDASSEDSMKVVNGMSYSKRNGENANSAIVVTINPEDYNGTKQNPLEGIKFQRALEHKAYITGNKMIPVQRFEDYKKGVKTSKLGDVTPNIKGKYAFADLNDIFPDYINQALKEAIDYFGERIKGYDNDNTILSAIESRTSSPVRIIRNENFQSNIEGLIPAGEGAGYAGGITSAAIDGMKIFEYIAKTYSCFK